MDYREWGMEYLGEAERLKRHTALLRQQLKRVSGETEVLLFRRISMLNEMYLECLHTGRCLLEKGDSLEARNKPEP
jgi:hypothetical protein